MDYSKIHVLILFAITISAFCLSSFSRAYYSKKITSDTKDYNLFNFVISILCAVILFALGGFDTSASLYTLILGVLFGIVTMLSAITNSVAMNTGPISYTSVIGNASTIITALSGYFFWNEKLTLVKLFGIALMIICCIMAVKKDVNEKKTSIVWFITAVMYAVFGACIGLIQKIHQKSEYNFQLNMFLVISFVVSAIVSLILYAVSSMKSGSFKIKYEGALPPGKLFMIVVLIFIINAVGVALNNSINLYLSGVIDSAVFFPVVNGSGLMFNILISFLFFKEKLTCRQWFGMLFGITAIVLLCI